MVTFISYTVKYRIIKVFFYVPAIVFYNTIMFAYIKRLIYQNKQDFYKQDFTVGPIIIT